jgi:hypothetical protein
LHRRRHQLGRLHFEICNGLAAHRAAVEDRDPGAHALQHGEETGAGRVDPDSVQADLGARKQRGRDDEGRRRREVSRDFEREWPQLPSRPDRHLAGLSPHAGAGVLEHPFAVIATRDRLADHGRPGARVQSGEEQARLDLRARDRKLVPNRGERASLDDERSVAVGRLDPSAHLAQRPRDPLERAARERLVADELEPAVLTGEDPGQEPHQRSGVPAVDRTLRWAQPPQAGAGHPHELALELDARPERSDSVGRRVRVRGGPEPGHRALPLGDRGDEESPVGDRLVARDGEVTAER